MRAVFGLLFIMLGLALAVVWMPENNGERQLAVVTEIATQGIPRSTPSGGTATRTFSPQTPLMATVDQRSPATQPQHVVAVARAVEPAPAVITPAVTVPQPVTSTTNAASDVITYSVPSASVVALPSATAPQRPSDVASPAPAPRMTEVARYELVRSLQRELKRVGCYWGEVDGDWGTGSRRAIATFTDRVNATLPTDQPDFILLALVQGHQGNICGKGCPSGQALSDGGRCVPTAVLARSRSGQDRQVATSRQETTPSAVPQVGAWASQVVPAAPVARAPEATTVGIAVSAATSAVVASVTPSPLPDPARLDGRMSVGGPRGSSGAYLSPPVERSIARAPVQERPVAEVPPPRRAQAATPRREKQRRAAGQRFPVDYRYGYARPPEYRMPRITPPSSYASAPRRNRAWTATFFVTQ